MRSERKVSSRCTRALHMTCSRRTRIASMATCLPSSRAEQGVGQDVSSALGPRPGPKRMPVRRGQDCLPFNQSDGSGCSPLPRDEGGGLLLSITPFACLYLLCYTHECWEKDFLEESYDETNSAYP